MNDFLYDDGAFEMPEMTDADLCAMEKEFAGVGAEDALPF